MPRNIATVRGCCRAAAQQFDPRCTVVIQYACEDTLDPDGKFRSGANVGTPRDGTPRDSDDAATDTIPATEEAAVANTVETRRYVERNAWLFDFLNFFVHQFWYA